MVAVGPLTIGVMYSVRDFGIMSPGDSMFICLALGIDELCWTAFACASWASLDAGRDFLSRLAATGNVIAGVGDTRAGEVDAAEGAWESFGILLTE